MRFAAAQWTRASAVKFGQIKLIICSLPGSCVHLASMARSSVLGPQGKASGGSLAAAAAASASCAVRLCSAVCGLSSGLGVGWGVKITHTRAALLSLVDVCEQTEGLVLPVSTLYPDAAAQIHGASSRLQHPALRPATHPT